MKQSTNTVLMVRPAAFGFNAETANSNAFQNEAEIGNVLETVLVEFDYAVSSLRKAGINVLVMNDSTTPIKPDAIFPNNWMSTQSDGRVFLFPMLAKNRRLERRPEILEAIKAQFIVKEIIDLSEHESVGEYLEGTGSMVFDHSHKTVFACLSERTNEKLLQNFAKLLNYKSISFKAADAKGKAIYHTNVMMAIGKGFAVVCLESIIDKKERTVVEDFFLENKMEVIAISHEQMENFAGNMLQVSNRKGEDYLILSTRAMRSLNAMQIEKLEKHTPLLAIPVPTIENIGGGGIRCMMAEIFLSPHK